MESLYLAAQVNTDTNGDPLDPKEHLSANLFECLFHRHIFTGNLLCFSGQKFDAEQPKPCDLVAQSLSTEGVWQVVCFAEVTRSDNKPGTLVEALESQVLDHCKNYLQEEHLAERVYACTVVGTSVRCWMYERGTESLVGFWSGQQTGQFACYLDVGLEENKETIMLAFDSMKKNLRSIVNEKIERLS